jgi:Putative capsular polysaccharide synthesis protein
MLAMSPDSSTETAKQDLYVVYTSGRVGSTTLSGTLRAHFGHDQVFKVHRLTTEGLAEYERFRPIWTDDKHVHRLLAEERSRFDLKLITLTRDPFASEVSSLFHNLEVHFPDRAVDSFEPEMLRQRLLETKSSSSPGYFVRWFDNELAPFTGIDVYAQPFPKERGWQRFSNDAVELLVLRLEDLDRVFGEALTSFLGQPIAELELHHIGDEQKYAELYKRFKATQRFPAEVLDRYYDTAYCRHFYTPEEIARFRQRWQQP